MGYWYMFRLAVVKIHDYDPTCDYDILAKNINSTCEHLRTIDHRFPVFGAKEISSAGGYGTGVKDVLKTNLIKLGEIYLNITFACYLFNYDFLDLSIITFCNKTILKIDEMNLEKISVGGYLVITNFDPECGIVNGVVSDTEFEYDHSVY